MHVCHGFSAGSIVQSALCGRPARAVKCQVMRYSNARSESGSGQNGSGVRATAKLCDRVPAKTVGFFNKIFGPSR